MQDLASSFLGLGNGGTYAALGLALVLTYRSSGVINFATGAQALYAGYTYAFLRQGKLFCIVPFLPTEIDLGHEFGRCSGHCSTSRSSARCAMPHPWGRRWHHWVFSSCSRG